MTMLSAHIAALSSKISCYHEFLSRYSKCSKVVYGFVEGKEDPCFYRGFIEQLLPDDWEVEIWPAGNKDQVYRIHAGLDWRRFNKKRVCFFVDRDLSTLIPERLVIDSNIYVTSGYSIENDLVKKATCQRVLTELCGFANANHADLEKICALFEQEFEIFLKAMIPVMACILAWRKNGMRANLNDIIMRDLFSIQNGRLNAILTPKGKPNITHYLHDQCNVVQNSVTNESQTQALVEFGKSINYKKLTRGKYVFWFLIEFCNTVHRDAVTLFTGITKPPKINVTLSSSNGMAVIGARARFPTSLKDFLKVTFCAYSETMNAKAG